MTSSLTFAHLSDIHLSPLIGFTPRYWNAKRALGFMNWQRGRKAVHRREVADRIAADAWASGAQHIVVTGDLINIGLPAEYDSALVWLRSVGPPDRVTVIPGNHDIYSKLSRHAGVGLWSHYMNAGEGTPVFPFVKTVGPVAFIGLNSAIHTRPFVASGRLGSEQIARAIDAIGAARAAGFAAVVMIHHPPLVRLGRERRGLEDAAAFEAALKDAGADLVLHGHNHADTLVWHGSAFGPVPILGVATSSAAIPRGREPLARYNLLTITKTPDGLAIARVLRGLASPGGDIVEIERNIIASPPVMV